MSSKVKNKNETKQDYVTPMDLIHEIEGRFGVKFMVDLAATIENKRCYTCYTLTQDSLKQDWFLDYLQDDLTSEDDVAYWLNPPFKNTSEWMKKCAEESDKGAKIVTLTLASIGSKWYRDYVQPNALSLITERIKFDGQPTGFNRDTMITLWGFGMRGLGWWDTRI